MKNEIAKLQAIAIERYEIDGGEMLETFDEGDYTQLIAERGSAESAWDWHIQITEARREAGGFYESF